MRCGGLWICPQLEVPNPNDAPAECVQFCVDPAVSLLVPGDLGVPVRPAPSRPILARMAMPERPVDKDRDARATEGEVGLPGKARAMASPASNT